MKLAGSIISFVSWIVLGWGVIEIVTDLWPEDVSGPGPWLWVVFGALTLMRIGASMTAVGDD